MTNFKNRSHTSVFALQNSKLAKKEMAQKNSHELRTDDLTLLPRGVSLDDPCLCVHHNTGIMSHPPETKGNDIIFTGIDCTAKDSLESLDFGCTILLYDGHFSKGALSS